MRVKIDHSGGGRTPAEIDDDISGYDMFSDSWSQALRDHNAWLETLFWLVYSSQIRKSGNEYYWVCPHEEYAGYSVSSIDLDMCGGGTVSQFLQRGLIQID